MLIREVIAALKRAIKDRPLCISTQMDAFTTAAYVLAAFTLLSLIGKLYRLLVFTYTYFPDIHNHNINKYMWSERSYALVTGATDGIGKALAIELYTRGFNVIIHGRNDAKLAAVCDEVRGSSAKEGDVRIWKEDAGVGRWDSKPLLDITQGIDLTFVALVNGGVDVVDYPFDGQTEDEVNHIMSLNFMFSVHVIRTLMPSLRLSATRGPVTLFGLGSVVALAPFPHFALYGAGKRALEFVLWTVAADERFHGRGQNLNIKYIQVGNVHTASNPAPPDWQTPTSAAFAKDILRRIDAPWRWAAANFVHAVTAWFMGILPENVAERMAQHFLKEKWGEKLTGKRSD
ncbi:NAD(P)-binding protein [Exidia glandulosa HHB12029]|uniref:NAD(P)-binding protein n=1 Tax=Exidia glandulosa HHB12029 TaxID=1314781 RepID=A0A165Q1U8_EXIGL|nr:NAD(P)-binding protein [Exidia glandulosa HHB12029]